MFKKLFGKITGPKRQKETVIVPKSDPEYRLEQAKYYVRLLRQPSVDKDQPIAFHAQLKAVEFDFSESSLDALDEVLLSIRSDIPGDFDFLVATHSGLNLIVALGCYLGLTVSYLGKLPLAWVGYEKALEFKPSLPHSVDNDLAAFIGKTLTFPANVIGEMLFSPLPARTCATYAKTLMSGVPNTDRQLLGLSNANSLAAALQAGEMTEEAALVSILDLAVYIPSAVVMQRKPPYAENWRPVMIERNGIAYQWAFTSLHFAGSLKQAEPQISNGGIVPFSWLVEMIPNGVGLAVNVVEDSGWKISPEAIFRCKEILANRRAGA